MGSIKSLFSSIVIQIRLIILKIFNFFLNIFHPYLIKLYHLAKFPDRYIHRSFSIIFGSYYSSVTFDNNGVRSESTTHLLFKQDTINKDHTNRNIFLAHLTILYRLVNIFGRCIEKCLGIICGNNYSLVTVVNVDFVTGSIIHLLIKPVKIFGRCIEKILGIICGNHRSLVNVADGDFSIGTTAHQLFNQNNLNKDRNNPDIYDLFHIYLSKILYERSDQIKDQCVDWGFDRKSIEILTYIQCENLKKCCYSTQAAAIHFNQSNTIIIAFRGTEPMDLLQWLTDATTHFIKIKNVLNNEEFQVHAGFHSALGLHEADILQEIDSTKITKQSPMFIQLLNFIKKYDKDDNKCSISITGHSLGGGLASLFSFVLLVRGYESSISGVYTYGQPLVGGRRYAQLLNNKLGKRFRRWVNHSDIVTRIPIIELPSIAGYYAPPQSPYRDALETAANHRQAIFDIYCRHYYHSGFRFRINHQGNLQREELIDEGPILAYHDKLDLFHLIYSIKHAIHSLCNITPIRSFLWLTFPSEINDHFPGDYARKIKKMIRTTE